MLCACFFVVYAALSFGYATLNETRYGHFCIAKLGNAHLPFYRLFVQEQAISPDHGPASARLAEFVESNVLTHEVFREHGIDEEIFFKFSSQRMFNTLLFALQEKGDSTGEFSLNEDFDILRKAALESLFQDPIGSMRRYVNHLANVFSYQSQKPIRWRVGKLAGRWQWSDLRERQRAWSAGLEAQRSRYVAEGVPLPNENDFIPPQALYLSSSNSDSGNLFGIAFQARPWQLRPVKSTNLVSEKLMRVSEWLIPDYRWFLSSFLCLVIAYFLGERDFRIPVLTGIAMLSLLASLFGSVQWEFRSPFDPVLTANMIFGFGAVFQKRHELVLLVKGWQLRKA